MSPVSKLTSPKDYYVVLRSNIIHNVGSFDVVLSYFSLL